MFSVICKFIVALFGKIKNKNIMANNEQFPRFIPDKPTGDDVFEGKSQSHLANSICKYILSNDSNASSEKWQMPRIIGLEGKWGSGKSNVVENIKKHLDGEGYHTFTYDAWGHQEDLQRRSILETLTNDLIENKVLGGRVEIKMRNGESNKAEWKDQLSLLLSNKTTTITKPQTRLTGSAIWGIVLIGLFTLLNIIINQLLDNIDKQCVIFTKDLLRYDRDTEKRELDFDKINQLSCSVYRIQKAPGYDEEDLSTIRTITERIK